MKLKMARIEIVGLRQDLPACLGVLGELGCVHIEDVGTTPDVGARALKLTPEALREQERIRLLLAQIDGILREFGSPRAGPEPADPGSLADAEAGVTELMPAVQALATRRTSLEGSQSSLARYETTLEQLLPVLPASTRAPENVTVCLFGSRSLPDILDQIQTQVIGATGGHLDFVARNVDDSTRAMVFVFPAEYAGAVEAVLGRQDVGRLRLPHELGSGPPPALLENLRRRLAAIPDELKQINAELDTLAARWSGRLLAWRDVLRDELDTFTVRARLGETETTFVLVGWLPAAQVHAARRALETRIGPAILVYELPVTAADMARAPVALVNPAPARPFEALVRLQNLPRYQGIDPTGLMAIGLPLFFGMMLGDIGYSLLIFALTLVLARRFKRGVLHDLFLILRLGSLWGIVFGIIFGELFGTLGERLGLHPLLFDRASPEHVSALLLMAIAVGAVHVLLGLILGVWQAVQLRSRSHLLERGGMLVGLLALFLVVGAAANILPAALMTPGVAGVLVGIVILSASFGWLGILIGPLEFIGLIGNVMSYLRIAAIGLASVYLAKVANDMAGAAGSIVVGIIIAVLIHALNLALGVFSPTIHSLRLHYVEFFRKFYEGGGVAYAPFRRQSVTRFSSERTEAWTPDSPPSEQPLPLA